MAAPRKKFLIKDKAITKISDGNAQGVLFVEDILAELAQCCGIDCCDGVIRLDSHSSQTTGTTYPAEIKIMTTDAGVASLVLSVTIGGTVYTTTLAAA